MDRRGYRFNLYNIAAYGYGLGADNLNFSVPVLLSSNGYALFFDNPSKGYFDIGLTDKNVLEAGFVSGELTFYVVFGKNMDEMLNNYTAIYRPAAIASPLGPGQFCIPLWLPQ